MRLVSPLLKHVIYPGLSKAGYLRRATQTAPTVLTYHGVLPAEYKIIDPRLDGNLVSTESFRRHLQFLRDRYNIISPEEFLRWCEGSHNLPPRTVLLTCDDGLRNCLYDMLPALREFEIDCLFFVTGASLSHVPTMLWYEELYLMLLAAQEDSMVELPSRERVEISWSAKRSAWWELVKNLSQRGPEQRKEIMEAIRMQLRLREDWDAQYREDPVSSRRFLSLNECELKQFAASGVCIGAHTLSHPMLSQSTTETAQYEISESKRKLDQLLGQETWAFAYPFGDSTSVTFREIEMAEHAGFKAAFLNVDADGASVSRFSIPRVHVTAGMTLPDLEARISGIHRSLQRLFGTSSLRTLESHA